MANFDKAFDYTVKNEGGYQHDETDLSRGATKYGITESTLSAWLGHHVSHEDIAGLDIEEAKHIYRVLYWEKFGLDRIKHDGVATALFDMCVNHGVSRAQEIAMHAVGDCGKIIPHKPFLSESINDIYPVPYLHALKDRRDALYVHIVAAHPEQQKFIKGWLARSSRMQTLALS